jgi:aquaporin Z
VREAVVFVASQVAGAIVGSALVVAIASGVDSFGTLIHLISIPVTNTSVNPARSTGPAAFVGGWALEQLWLFWLAPILGAVLAGIVHTTVIQERAQAFEGH